ncbi:uncharacterized protein SETTUDRAFT_43617 [Exserohilum turcica Et28A]|uniref:Heterokaryon incompatibility domain-containing protein n=1 Tax=Exserohilum turcicum (strain 28A) TaxID=671987 RepID=R0JZ93_EXST2|nr:uncharacterized protein SETTUDRAFT_43617 [Exserohilum turcica Et28A]EOA82784.1 hypothetical protein SETTUDRAFT_43617 [Exserohilum turcica Et28A]
MRLGDRASEKAVEKVQSWLNECDKAHPHCRKVETCPLPTRVLDISCEGSCWNIRLLNSNGLTAAYTALSHCWGKEVNLVNGQISKCTSGNINQLLQGFSIDALPALYRDAVIMTQKLGKRYLWIDSLCIIQDSKDDWSKECARMTDVYAKSYLTISAASCKNYEQGFLKATTVETQARLTTIPGSQDRYIYIRPFHRPEPRTPLMHRAWVFQERILSTRVLHLTSFEMVFLCDQYEAGEGGFFNRESVRCREKRLLYDADIGVHFSAYSRWRQVVQSYSELDLTYKTDKLPALSGAARLIQERTGDRYLAGLWKSNLVAGLMWQATCQKKAGANHKTTYIAPTWSWASIQDHVIHYQHSIHNHPFQLKVVDAQVCLSTPNPFGEVSSASLIIDAPLRKFLACDVTNSEIQGSFTVDWGIRDTSGDFLFAFDDAWYPGPESRTLYLLPCVSDAALGEEELGWFHDSMWHGLALEPVDRENRIYKRIGVFHFHRTVGQERTWYALGFADARVTII